MKGKDQNEKLRVKQNNNKKKIRTYLIQWTVNNTDFLYPVALTK